MAADNYYVKCPFYKKDKTMEIRCEGVCEESRTVQQFRNKEKKREYYGKYCKEAYRKCRIYKMMMQKYDEKGE